MTSTLFPTRISPVSDARWVNLTARYPESLFTSPPWLAALEDTYGFQIQASLLLGDDGQPLAGVPYVIMQDARGSRIGMLPFCDFCDPLVSSFGQWDSVTEPLLALGLPISTRCLHTTVPLNDPRFSVSKRARWHGLDLSPTLDELWSGIDSSARRAIRKAEKSGVTVRLAPTEDDLRAFFDLHLGIRKYKYGLLAQPYRFFEAIRWRFLPEHRYALMLAEVDAEVVGGVLYLAWGDTLYYKFSASSLARLDARPTDLLIWEAIKFAKAANLSRLDFGLSDWDQEGLVRYKRKFASEEGAISFLHHAADRRATAPERQVGTLLGELTALLTDPRVPDDVTERAGNLLYGLFG